MATQKIDKKELFNEARFQSLMQESDVAAVIASSPANVTYTSGYQNVDMKILPERMKAVILPREGSPTLMLNGNRNTVDTFIEDVRRYAMYEGVMDPGLWALVDILRSMELVDEKVGIEMRYVTGHTYDTLKREFPRIRWVAADDILERTRQVKTPAEIELMRHAARVTDRAIAMAYQGATPTDTEKSVGDAMSYNVMRFGADIVAFNILASGKRMTAGHHTGAPVPLEPGGLMRCDFGATFQGYYSDLARLAVVGKQSQRQKDTYARYLEVHQRTLDFVRPGVTGEEIFNFACGAYRDHGLSMPMMGGHSIGLVIHERPVIIPGDNCEVEEGMVMCIETVSSVEEHDEHYHLEDMVVVKKNGLEVLSDYINLDAPTRIA
jgi:Xaa-Pro aminopeptidase